jgi:hypothetical protein
MSNLKIQLRQLGDLLAQVADSGGTLGIMK